MNPRLAPRLLFVILPALALGTLVNALRPDGIPWAADWSHRVENEARAAGLGIIAHDAMQRLADDGTAIILDARTEADYQAGHIPGALPFPHNEAETAFAAYELMLLPGEPIVVYCAGLECDDSLQLGMFLRDRGFTNILIYAGGYTAWLRARAAEPAP